MRKELTAVEALLPPLFVVVLMIAVTVVSAGDPAALSAKPLAGLL